MCGIVAYFGNADNPLTRILTGMWSIIYRAPDSTGVGVFGDEVEPVRSRKALGSALELVQELHANPLYLRSGSDVAQALADMEKGEEGLQQAQRRLLEYEGLSLEYIQAWEEGRWGPPTWQELRDPSTNQILEPGMVGQPRGQQFSVSSPEDLALAIQTMMLDLDLPPMVVKAIVQGQLQQALEQMSRQGELPVEVESVLQDFEDLFAELAEHEKLPRPAKEQEESSQGPSGLGNYLWQALRSSTITLPLDYDPDGVRRLFAVLDGLFMSSLGSRPEWNETVQAATSQMFQARGSMQPAHWQTFYRTERALNVYGLAAAAVYSVLLKHKSYTFPLEARFRPDADNPGRTTPRALAALGQPVLAHGRWALQSQVTLQNTHPFVDQENMRCACVNGQFSSEVERRVRRFLLRVAKVRMRSENSTEYFVQLWGYYARVLSREKDRYEAIRLQIQLGLDELDVGSHCIDHQVFHRLQDLDAEGIEELAFMQAMRVMIQDGGQVAAAGISLNAPHRIFAASHNRPLFVVQRSQSREVMLVSDVNAALGLFPQSQIQNSAKDLRQLLQGGSQASKKPSQGLSAARKSIMDQFQVWVTPLQGEELLARVEAVWEQEGFGCQVRVTDFTGQEADIESFVSNLSPVQIKKDLNRSFYEMHLQEIPDRLQEILGSYLPAGEKADLGRFGINKRLLLRRFGKGLSSLRRVFLVGLGSSYHAAGMAKNLLRELAPELTVVVLTPVEVDDIKRTIDPDRDLAVCLSWSGTTADMVQFAKDLFDLNIVAVGITEKPFGDMALFLRKSGGVFSVQSGEEVTVSAVKSLLCMLLGLEAFCLALLHELGYKARVEFVASRMQELPKKVQEVLQSESLAGWCRRQSAAFPGSQCHLVLDAQHSVGAGTEIALKLEENSWLSMGKTVDFRDLEEQVLVHWQEEDLILVNATNRARLQEALACARSLSRAGRDFVLVSFENESLPELREQLHREPALLPKLEDVLQPFLDLVFHMQFALEFGLAQGRSPGEFPRNRAKSVTAGRSRPRALPTPARVIASLAQKNEAWRSKPGFEKRNQDLEEPSAWEGQNGLAEWEHSIYQDLRRLCSLLLSAKPLENLLSLPESRLRELAWLILDQLAVDGEIVLVPLDKTADATARTVAKHWALLLGCFIRVDSPGSRLFAAGEDSLLILLAADEPEDYVLQGFLPDLKKDFLWIGPSLAEPYADFFSRSQAYAPLRPKGLSCSQDLLYAAVCLFLTRILQEKRPAWARVLMEHFSQAGQAVAATLHDLSLKKEIQRAVQDDACYRTALFIGPATGNGLAWVRRFDQNSMMLLEWYAFGFSAHGPLVTVDNQVQEKFVSLADLQGLQNTFDSKTLQLWEQKYFQGQDLEQALAQEDRKWDQAPVAPFQARQQWFLPELRPGYDCGRDNLVLIDATSEQAFGQALDELATFGCRFARMSVISQAAFSRTGRLAALQPHPISHLLLLPDLGAPVSEYQLPFVQTLLSTAWAASTT